MPTIPTGQMERELRQLYLRWLRGLTYETGDISYKVDQFARWSTELIEEQGGRTAMMGALAGFPAPAKLDLSPHIGTIYSDMKQAAIQAGIVAGLNSTDVARQMFNAGMDKSFNRLNRLARTETVSAYWKNAWDSVADLPALVMVWGSEDGPRTCPWCRERDGLVMDSSNLRDHPNGRCTPIPMLRSQVDYRGSINSNGDIYMDPRWAKGSKKINTVDDVIADNRQAKTIMNRATSPEVKTKDIQDLVSRGKLSKADGDTLLSSLKTTSPAKPPVKSVPKAPASSTAQFEARQPWPNATEKDLPFNRAQFVKSERAVRSYVQLGYENINAVLRGGRPLSEKMSEIVSDLKALTASRTTKDLTLHRGMLDFDFLGPQFRKEGFDPTLLVGKSFQDKGFISTSYGGSSALEELGDLPIQMEILAPKGTRGSLINNDREREFLLDADSTFTVLDAVRDAAGVLRVRVALTKQGRS
ncbi:capsid maturation protease and MuF-like fusion protein [Microbacterium phage Neferthena]|uniref:Capsid maturation protease and MuF-like fusion protein n=1 Tax=Microbacterium phage Neferthena TaxID=2301539 RepID=A0A385D492_9CAUD|nr:head morphogenesis [Microbacterium phage Neferthena]AXQ52869.1 capsid maturation protease and MuF-like fusion protein [Microbacterium phage Neferthena]